MCLHRIRYVPEIGMPISEQISQAEVSLPGLLKYCMSSGHFSRNYREDTTKENVAMRHHILSLKDCAAFTHAKRTLARLVRLNMGMRCPVGINLHATCIYVKPEYFIQIKGRPLMPRA